MIENFNLKKNSNVSTYFVGLIIIIEVLNLFYINIFNLGNIFPLSIIWVIALWHKRPFDINKVLLLCLFGLIFDIVNGVNIGTNILINYITIILAYAQRKLFVISTSGNKSEALIISIHYIISNFIFGLLIHKTPNVILLTIPIIMAIYLYPYIYSIFNNQESEA